VHGLYGGQSHKNIEINQRKRNWQPAIAKSAAEILSCQLRKLIRKKSKKENTE